MVLASTFTGKSTNASPPIIKRTLIAPRPGRPGCEVCCAFLEPRASAMGYPDIRIFLPVSRRSRQKMRGYTCCSDQKPTGAAQVIATDECSTKRVSTSCSPDQEIPQLYQRHSDRLQTEAQ